MKKNGFYYKTVENEVEKYDVCWVSDNGKVYIDETFNNMEDAMRYISECEYPDIYIIVERMEIQESEILECKEHDDY